RMSATPTCANWLAGYSGAKGLRSEAQVAQARMVIGPATERPVVLAIALADRCVIDGCMTLPHQAVLVEFPILVAIRAEPVARIIVPLVGKPNRDAIALVRPKLLDQPVIQFLLPLSGKKGLNLLAAMYELGT